MATLFYRITTALVLAVSMTQASAPSRICAQEPNETTLPGVILGPVVPTGGQPAEAPIFFADEDRRPRTWGGVEYLLWWIKDGPQAFPLATTGSPNDPFPGALGQPNTAVLFGGRGLDYGTFSGLRMTFGAWRDDDQTFGWELSGFVLEQRSVTFSALSDGRGNPPIYIPVQRAQLGNAEGSFTISDPLLLGGIGKDLYIASRSRLWGTELNAVINARRTADVRSLDFLIGFRYLGLTEDLTFSPFLNEPAGTFYVREGFGTTNNFYGAQIGARAYRRWDLLYAEVTGKLALGVSHQTVDNFGSTIQVTPGGAVNGFPGGIFTMPTNIGRNSSDLFAVVPEVQVKAGVFLTTNVKAFVTYNFLYLSSVARPGDQIDRSINDTQSVGFPLVGPARPTPLFNHSQFWSQGIGFGLEWTY